GDKYVQPGETVRFFVTLNPHVQHIAEQQLSRLIKDGAVPPQYDAGAVMMALNGRVQAMVGSVNWSQRQFNNAVKARVQAGSTAKLPLLIAACEAGKSPESRVLDQPVRGSWPANGEQGYRGQTTLKEAFASSRNAAAVRLTQELGADTVATVSRRIGIDPGPAADSSFVLGSYSSNVMTMTAAYTAVANGGYQIEPSGVLAVVDGRGQVRADFLTPMRTRVIPEKCIEPTQALLREVVQNGTGRTARLKHWAAYGKTGTSTGNADAWFIGWSEQRVFGVWMGRRRGEPGQAVAGAGAPATYFGRVATAVNEWAERQQRLEEQRLANARTKRGLDPSKTVDWFSSLPRAIPLPDTSSAQERPSKEKRT
ncbi:transglycosylase domain-containing protein, partial [Microvirga aerilata]